MQDAVSHVAVQPPPPAHGHDLDSARSWAVVASAFIALFVTGGMVPAITAVMSIQDELDGFLGSPMGVLRLFVFASFPLAIIAGHRSDRVGPRPLLVTAAAFTVAGLLLTARAQSSWQAVLPLGIAACVGQACSIVPMARAVSAWFERRRTIALGIALTGLTAGSWLMPRIATKVEEAAGWRSTIVVVTALYAIGMLVAVPLANRPRAQEDGQSLRTFIAARSNFWYLFGSSALLAVATSLPVLFIIEADTPWRDWNAIRHMAPVSLIVGGVAFCLVASRFSGLRVLQLLSVGVGMSFLLATGPAMMLGAAPFLVTVSLLTGAVVALRFAVVVECYGTRAAGRMFGVIYTAVGIGAFSAEWIFRLAVSVGLGAVQVLMVACGVVAALLLQPLAGRPAERSQSVGALSRSAPR